MVEMPMQLLSKGTDGIFSASEGPRFKKNLLNLSSVLLGSVIF